MDTNRISMLEYMMNSRRFSLGVLSEDRKFPEHWGPLKWKELHTRAKEKEGQNDQAWLNQFAHSIPGNGCACKGSFLLLIKQNPPDWNNYYSWTVKIHNLINKKLGKPEWLAES